MTKSKRLAIRLSDEDYKLLGELRCLTGIGNNSDLVRTSLLIVDVLYKVGVFNLLKPLPELIKQTDPNGKQTQQPEQPFP